MQTASSRIPSDRINVLMYHSISDRCGPTAIPLKVFRDQLRVLGDCGYNAVSLSDLAAWHRGDMALPPRSVVITFDDGFADFADCAFPELQGNNWNATVFLPVAHVGKQGSWRGADETAGDLLTWDQAKELADKGIDFGSHSMTHRDLTTLESEQLRWEIRQSRNEIEQRLHKAPISFAPPYGRSDPEVQEEIGKWYRLAVGTRLQRACRLCNPLDVPRIEMHYFRNLDRWRAYLEGRAEGFFLARRALRGIRALVQA